MNKEFDLHVEISRRQLIKNSEILLKSNLFYISLVRRTGVAAYERVLRMWLTRMFGPDIFASYVHPLSWSV